MLRYVKSDCRVLLTSGEPTWLREHQSGFYLADKTRLPLEYLSAGYALLLINDNNHLVGGVSFVNVQSLFRTKMLCPVPFSPGVFSFEMNGLWLAPHCDTRSRLLFWLHVCMFILTQSPRAEFFFSFETKKTSLGKFYEGITEEAIYEGQVLNLPGMNGAQVYVERVCRTSVRFLSRRLPWILLKWMFQKRIR